MTRFLIYLCLLGAMLYFMSVWSKKNPTGAPADKKPAKSKFRAKVDPGETWVQVYETESMDEGRTLRARLQEEEVECVLYEQGKKDIHGNAMKGFGLAVPRTAAGHSQNVISRMLS